MNRKVIITVALFFSFTTLTMAQSFGVKSNLLYLLGSTPNIGFESRLASHYTFSLHGGYNPFNFPSKVDDGGRSINPKIRHWLAMPEIKYWFCKAFERSYIGIHGIYGEYNIGGIPISQALKDFRYEGNAYGGGISLGYQWALGNRWGLEFSVGAGFLRLHYKKYECGTCGEFLQELKRNYIGPTKLALNFIYFFK